MTEELTQARLRELLDYDPATGLFVRRAVEGLQERWHDKPAGYVLRGYLVITVDGRKYRAHRLAWLYIHGKWPEQEIDHRDGNKLNNRIANLRDVSHTVNGENRRQGEANGTGGGLIGASWFKARNKWMAQITVNRKQRYLGLFDTAEEAHAAYVQAKRQLHEGCTI